MNRNYLQDWPPSSRFNAMFPQLQEDFERVIPLPTYTGPIGVKNFAAHFPENANPPDLGKLTTRTRCNGSTMLTPVRPEDV